MTSWENEGLMDNTIGEGSNFPAQSSHDASDGFTSASEPVTVVYEGYKLFKADPIPGQEASWTKVERTKMIMSQREFCRKVQKRANKISAAQQYQFLPEIRQAHVNQLIAEKRPLNPNVEWSCVYAKERQKASKPRNARRDDYEVVSMQIILMKRPVNTKTHFRTPMGDLVDLGVHFGSHPNRPKFSREEDGHEIRDQDLLTRSHCRNQSVPAFPGAQRSQTFSGNEAVCQARRAQEPLPRPATATTVRGKAEIDHNQVWRGFEDDEGSSEETHYIQTAQDFNEEEEDYVSDNGDEGDTSPLHRTASSETSTVGSPGSVSCSCQDSAVTQKVPFDARQHSPSQYEFGFRSHLQRKQLVANSNLGRHMRNEPWYGSSNIPTKRPRSSASDFLEARVWEKRIRIERMNEEEMRGRLLDCEARIEQWEKILQNQTRILGLQMRIEAPPEQRCHQ
ncbi:hypothetical protein N7494_012531 [Penicillium frequentans]|uniref:Uncharacterized protein n=1 Tax=Penicillium frequentans TaxID=3151616 RepID=A0AAD6CLW0_9EURO|nr:hypothetical protein N7494_012531 [Penicillium glabrum]